jgi:F-type H+-transporting ATPase subunit beta
MLVNKLLLSLRTSKNLVMANQIKGKISQIIGPVIDVVFNEVEELPKYMTL